MNRHLLLCLILFLVGLVRAASATANLPAVVTLQASDHKLNLAGTMAWFKDETGALNIDDVQKLDAPDQKNFLPLNGELSAGFTPAAVWLRFDVQAMAGAPGEWILVVTNALFDDARLYAPDGAGRYIEHRSGEDIAREQWPIDYRTPAFLLDLSDTKPQRFYLRLWARNALSAQIVLWQEPAFAASTRNEAFRDGIYYGIFGLILIFHIFFGLWTRERLAGWYVPYVALNFLGAAFSAGYLQRLTGLSGSSSDTMLGVSICMVLGVSTTFVLLQLELSTRMPRFARVFFWVSWACGIATSLMVLSGRYAMGVSLAQMMVLATIAVLIPIAIRLAWQGHRPARFFLFAFGIFYAAVVLRYLRNLGVLPPMFITEHGVPITALLHMIVMSLGITGQYNQIKREKQAAQAALNESLEAQVAERTVALREEIARRELSEQETRRALDVEVLARQEQQEFVAMVSHEFRTPLAIIDTVTQQLAANLDAPREKSLRRCSNIRESTQRMTAMMDEFLSLDRLRGELRMRAREVDPVALLEAVADEWAPEQLRLEMGNRQELPEKIFCDVELMRVALRNLIANAVRHSPAGCVAVLTLCATDGDGVEIMVEDQGAGIPKDEIPKLFNKYFRGRAAQGEPGAGLGLYLVERIAMLHGGSVRLDERPGVGARFVLMLPEQRASAPT